MLAERPVPRHHRVRAVDAADGRPTPGVPDRGRAPLVDARAVGGDGRRRRRCMIVVTLADGGGPLALGIDLRRAVRARRRAARLYFTLEAAT